MGRGFTWTTDEEHELAAMAGRRFSTKRMAHILCRTPRAVDDRCSLLGLRRRVKRRSGASSIVTWTSAEPPVSRPRVVIARTDVVDWYAAGWRFVGFEGEGCVFEWPHADAPVRPLAYAEAPE